MGVSRRLVAVASVTLAGCSAPGEVTEPRYLHPPAAAGCPAVGSAQSVAESAPLAPDFSPVSAAICEFDVVVRPGASGIAGGWRWTRVRRSDGPLDELITALRTPPPTARGPVCPAVAQAPMYIALIDSSGRAVVPAIPADSCGFRLGSVDAAIRHLAWATVESRH